MMNWKYPLFEAVLTEGTAAGSPAAAAPAAAVANPAEPSALTALLPAAAKSLDWVQAKYIVKDAVGVVDEAASIRKQAEAYNPLVKRLGSGELPPEKLDGYKFAVPEGTDKALFDEWVKDPGTAKFIEGAHAEGFNNKQLQFALNAALQMQPQMDQAQVQERDAATTEYVKANLWKDDAAMAKGLGEVVGVVEALAAKTGINRDAFTSPLTLANGITLPPAINDPRMLALLSAIAPEMKLGSQPQGSTVPATDLNALMKGPAYMNASHPDHESVKARVTAHFASLPGGSGKSSGPVIISSQ